MKRQVTYWEISIIYVTDKGSICPGIFKNSYKPIRKRQRTQQKNVQRILRGISQRRNINDKWTHEVTQPSVIREMQIKNTINHHFRPKT